MCNYYVQHAAITAGLSTCCSACNYCNMLHAIKSRAVWAASWGQTSNWGRGPICTPLLEPPLAIISRKTTSLRHLWRRSKFKWRWRSLIIFIAETYKAEQSERPSINPTLCLNTGLPYVMKHISPIPSLIPAFKNYIIACVPSSFCHCMFTIACIKDLLSYRSNQIKSNLNFRSPCPLHYINTFPSCDLLTWPRYDTETVKSILKEEKVYGVNDLWMKVLSQEWNKDEIFGRRVLHAYSPKFIFKDRTIQRRKQKMTDGESG